MRPLKERGSGAAAVAAAAVFVMLWAWYGLKHVSPFAASWDEVDFVLALDRFDLLAMQPHFPGYPYFVLGAMAVRRIIGDPVTAYGVLNVILGASSAWPIWRLARRLLSPWWSCAAVMLVLTAPYLWLQSERPMSEAAGIAILWWFLWCWRRAMERPSWGRALAALFVFGLLMGVRLSYAPFGLALVWLWGISCAEWRAARKGVLARTVFFWGAGAAFQLLWVAGLALSEGGFAGFVKLAEAFTAGHFSEWGGGIAAAPDVPPAERLLRFAGDNVLWTGMFARSTALLAAAAALLLAAVVRAGSAAPPRGGAGARPGRARLARRAAAWLRRPAVPGALAALAGAYGVWALLAQNIDKPRHITPLIGVMWLLLLAMFRAPAPGPRPAAPARPRAARPSAAGAAVPAAATGSAPPDAGGGPSPQALPGAASKGSGCEVSAGTADMAANAPSTARRTAPAAQATGQPASPASAPAQTVRIRRALTAAGSLLAACVITMQTAIGASLTARQASELPAVYQLADALRAMAQQDTQRRIVVYTWEEERVLDYLRTPVVTRRILTYDYFVADVKADPSAKVLLTDHVLKGFEAQVGPLRNKVKPIRTFNGEPLFDPVYSTITLYEWVGGQPPSKP